MVSHCCWYHLCVHQENLKKKVTLCCWTQLSLMMGLGVLRYQWKSLSFSSDSVKMKKKIINVHLIPLDVVSEGVRLPITSPDRVQHSIGVYRHPWQGPCLKSWSWNKNIHFFKVQFVSSTMTGGLSTLSICCKSWPKAWMGNFNDREATNILSSLPEGQTAIMHFHHQ